MPIPIRSIIVHVLHFLQPKACEMQIILVFLFFLIGPLGTLAKLELELHKDGAYKVKVFEDSTSAVY